MLIHEEGMVLKCVHGILSQNMEDTVLIAHKIVVFCDFFRSSLEQFARFRSLLMQKMRIQYVNSKIMFDEQSHHTNFDSFSPFLVKTFSPENNLPKDAVESLAENMLNSIFPKSSGYPAQKKRINIFDST